MKKISILLFLIFNLTCYAQIDTVLQRTGYATCNNLKPKLYVNVVGGIKPYIITINGTSYKVNKIDSIYLPKSGKFNGSIKDSVGYIKQILFIVDTLKVPINQIQPYITTQVDSFVSSNNDISLIMNTSINDASYNIWDCNKTDIVSLNTASKTTNNLLVKSNYSGKLTISSFALYNICNTLVAYKEMNIYPNITKDTILSSMYKKIYHIHGTLPITLHVKKDSIEYNEIINSNTYIYEFDTTKSSSIRILGVSDTSNLSSRVSLYDEYIYVNKPTLRKDVIDSTLIFYQAFSPGSDGFNDYFYIGNYMDDKMDFKFGYGSLQVVDRDGLEVYKSEIYRNDWDGKNNKKIDLYDAVYFYIFVPFKITKAIPIKGGFVEIKRN